MIAGADTDTDTHEGIKLSIASRGLLRMVRLSRFSYSRNRFLQQTQTGGPCCSRDRTRAVMMNCTKYDVKRLPSFVAIARSTTTSSVFFAHPLQRPLTPFSREPRLLVILDSMLNTFVLVSTPLPCPRPLRSRLTGME